MVCISPGETARALGRTALFQDLPPADRERLTARLRQRRFADGQRIFGQGDPGSSMLAVMAGRVRIGITSRDGREVLLGIIEPGEVFGELALLDGKVRSADATALGSCVLVSLDRADLLPLLRQSPDMAIRICAIVCDRMRAATDRIESAALLGVGARLARLLLTLADRAGTATRVKANLSQEDMGRLIGASRQKVNAHLQRWIAVGVLARDGHTLKILDRGRLRVLADAEDD